MSKSTRGARVAGIAGLAVTLSIGVAAPAFAAAGFEFARIAGDDRYATAVKASEQYGASKDVIIANGQPGEYADALAGNYLAGATDAPILLTKRSGLPEVTKDRLATIKPTNVWIVGGTAAVPADQEAELKAAGYNVVRLAGDDRFGTNAKVIAEDGAATGGVGLIATGLNFPDALAAGPFAYKGHSLGLSRTNSLPDVVGDALEADGVKQVLIFGGTDAVGAGVVSDLAARGITVLQRFAGADRSETSELAAEWAVANLKFSDEHVGVASGYTEGFGADALAGGPVEGNENSPMLITRNVDNPDDVLDYLKKHANTLADGHIYGGTAAISQAAEDAMEAAARSTTTNQRYTANPSGNQTVEAGSVQQFTFSGLTAGGKVDIQLVDCSNVATDASGTTTFSGTNPGGSGNVAQNDNPPTATVTVVNGVAGAPTDEVTVPSSGSVTFSVDTTGDAGTCYVAVVFNDADDDDRIDLGADNKPTEAFGNSGDVTVVAAEAADNFSNPGVVTSVDKTANLFQATSGGVSRTFYYDSNDEFILAGSPNTPLTMDQFEARISAGDSVAGTYRSNPANQSSFTLTDSAPIAPDPVIAQEPTTTANAGKQGIEIVFDDSDTPSVASYNIYRATATQPSITGQPITCPTDAAAFSKIGSVADVSTAAPGGSNDYAYLDATAVPGADATPTNPSYCYYVTSVDATGDEGPKSTTTAPSRAYKAAPASQAPKFVAGATATYGAGTFTITLPYSENLSEATLSETVPGTNNGSEYTVQYTQDGATYQLTVTGATASDGGASDADSLPDTVTLTATAPAGLTVDVSDTTGNSVTVTAKNGTDGNTVGDDDTPQQFQVVGDAVFVTDTTTP